MASAKHELYNVTLLLVFKNNLVYHENCDVGRGRLTRGETGKFPDGPLALSIIQALLIPHILHHEIYKNEPKTM